MENLECQEWQVEIRKEIFTTARKLIAKQEAKLMILQCGMECGLTYVRTYVCKVLRDAIIVALEQSHQHTYNTCKLSPTHSTEFCYKVCLWESVFMGYGFNTLTRKVKYIIRSMNM